MGDEMSDSMNLDLNLGPGPDAGPVLTLSEDSVNDQGERLREAATRFRTRQRWRWRQVLVPVDTQTLSMDLIGNQTQALSMDLIGNQTILQTGEASVAAEERVNEETPKACENNNGFLEEDVMEKKDDLKKEVGTDGSFFDCNICLDLATDPVVTCCGHLFCWPCLYRWLHMSSYAKECPVCKGEVTTKNVTPIYGRGNLPREVEDDPGLNIPVRPNANRVESLRQTFRRNSFPVEEMIRRIQSRFDRDLLPPRETSERATISLLNRARGLRGEQNPTPTSTADDVDLMRSLELEHETRQIDSLLLRRQLQLQLHSHSHRARISSALTSAERSVDAYLRNHPVGRNAEQAPHPVDDRDSFSSVAAVMNSESQVDNAAEIDSLVTLSTSSSRRRNDSSRVSDVDSADSRAPRRRRLN